MRLVLVLLAPVALASDRDPRGWSRGTMAVDTAKVVATVPDLPLIAVPKVVLDRVTGPTVLFYYSPSCPHCRAVAGEVQGLHERLRTQGSGILGVASGSADEAELAEFQATFGVTFPVLSDRDGEIQAAMAVRSTPSAMLVVPKGKGKLEVHDLWYPYLPGWDALVEARVLGDVWKVFRPGEYLGNNVCGTCHREEHESWTLTHHSVAWRTLELEGATGNAECTGCHVTGAGQPTGWTKELEGLVDVGCEACHGPGGPHDGARIDARTTCAGCHDAKHSIAFTVEKGVPLIDHYRTNALSNAEKTDLRKALFQGEAPRDLLAFPDGANVGSARCQTCHAVEHAWWSENAHANAMASLQKEGSRDPDCVRCHATAKRSGPPPDAIDGFDTLGGVGCESCHGPGEKHAASQAAADIQGLGESCPVCVIEAVCTGCHTAKWSPDFDLDRALEAIRHAPAPL